MDLSFIFPCLNEEETLEYCINQVKKSLEQDKSINYEVIIADNNSTDNSVEVAKSAGARVVHIKNRGYGAALIGGINAAEGKYVMFADADGSYHLDDTLKLYQKTSSQEIDMGIASRMNGAIEHGAMPFLHRHLGTPVLTSLINIFFKGKLSDCNSGFRCIKKTAFDSWNIRSQGMEFASEQIIRALKSNSSITEISSGLNQDLRSRPPHLRTWRDGMRHLLFILSEKPQAMEIPGLTIIILASIFQIIAILTGPTLINRFNLFDYHTHALLLLVAGAGVQLYLLGCYIYVHSEEAPTMITKNILHMDEGLLLFLLIISFSLSIISVLLVFFIWTNNSFSNLQIINPLFVFMHFVLITGFLSIGILGIHIVKNTK